MTTENKKLIAEFMELSRQLHLYEHPLTGEYVDPESLNYDTDWNMLMPVVEKIEGCRGAVSVYIYKDSCQIETRLEGFKTIKGGKTKIEATYEAVVEFVKWRNS